jgi:hypothetical protein
MQLCPNIKPLWIGMHSAKVPLPSPPTQSSPAQPFPSLRLLGVDNYYYYLLLGGKVSLSSTLPSHLAG